MHSLPRVIKCHNLSRLIPIFLKKTLQIWFKHPVCATPNTFPSFEGELLSNFESYHAHA